MAAAAAAAQPPDFPLMIEVVDLFLNHFRWPFGSVEILKSVKLC